MNVAEYVLKFLISKKVSDAFLIRVQYHLSLMNFRERKKLNT